MRPKCSRQHNWKDYVYHWLHCRKDNITDQLRCKPYLGTAMELHFKHSYLLWNKSNTNIFSLALDRRSRSFRLPGY